MPRRTKKDDGWAKTARGLVATMKHPGFQKWTDGLVAKWQANEHEKRLVEQQRNGIEQQKVDLQRQTFRGNWKAYLVRSVLAFFCLGTIALLGWVGTIDRTTLAVMLTAVVASLFVPSK